MSTIADLTVVIGADVSDALSGIGRVQSRLQSLGDRMTDIGKVATLGLTAPIVAGMAVATKTAADFEEQINILGVAARSSGTSMDDLARAAITVGQDTQLVGISASEAAEAMTNFYKAGLSTRDMFGNLNKYLREGTNLTGAMRAAIDLAAASELNLDQASQVVAVAMSTFGLSAQQATQIANTFVQTADAGVASVQGLADALVNVGPTAAAMGMSLQDTTIALGLLAERGIQGAEAGTQLKSMLLNMQRTTPAVTKALKELNVSLYDEQGAMRPLPAIMEDLRKATAGMTQEQRNWYIKTIAGNYGLNAMNVLLDEGAEGWASMAQAVAHAATAQQQAEARTRGFNAAMEQLQGALEAFLINVGMPLIQTVLTPMARALGDIIGRLSAANPKVVGFGLAIAGVAAAAGPVLMVLGYLASSIAALLSPMGLVIGAVAALAVAWHKNWGGIQDKTRAAIDYIVSKFGWMRDTFAGVVDVFNALVEGNYASAWERARAIASDFAANFGTSVRSILSDAADTFGQMYTVVAGKIEEITGYALPAWDMLVQGIHDATSGMISVLADEFSWLGDTWQSTISMLRTLIDGDFRGAWEQAKAIVADFAMNFGQSMQHLAPMAADAFGQVYDAIVQNIANATGTTLPMWDDFASNFVGIWQMAMDFFGPAIQRLRDAFAGLGDELAPLQQKFANLFDATIPAMQYLGEVVGAVVAVIVDLLINTLAATLTHVGDVLGGVIDGMTGALHLLTDVVSGVVEIVSALLDNDFNGAWLAAQDMLAAVVGDMGEILNGLLEAVTGILGLLYDAIISTVNDIAGTSIPMWDELGGAIQDTWDNILMSIQDTVVSIMDAVTEWLENTWDAIQSFDLSEAASVMFTTALDAILDVVGQIMDAVLEWLDETLYSIESFDLTGAAEAMFQRVLDGIEAIISEIVSGVESWLADTESQISGFDLTGAATAFFDRVLVGIADKIAEIVADVAQWMDDTFDAIASFDLTAAAHAAFDTMVIGLLEKLVEAVQNVQKWLENVKSKIESYSFKSATLKALQTIIAAIIQKHADVLKAIGKLLQAVKDKIAGFSLHDVGTKLMDGLKAGIMSRVHAIADAAAAAVRAAINAAKAAAGIFSPSRVAAKEIGEPFTQGIAMGVLNAIGELVNAVSTMAADISTEGAKQFADAAKAIADMILPAIDAILALKNFEMVESVSLQAQMERVVDIINELTSLLNDAAAQYKDGALKAVQELAKAATAAAKMVSPVVDAIYALSDFDVISTSDLDDRIRNFADIITDVVNALYDANDYFTNEGLKLVSQFAKTAKSVAAMVGPTIDALLKLNDFDMVTNGDLGRKVHKFAGMIGGVVGALSDANNYFTTIGLKNIEQFAKTAKAIANMVGPAIDALLKLNDFDLVTHGQLGAKVHKFASMIGGVVGALSDANNYFTMIGLKQIQQFAKTAKAVAQMVKPTIDALYRLAEFQAVDGVREATVEFVAQISQIVLYMQTAAQTFSKDGLDAVKQFAGVIKPMSDAIKRGLEALDALMNASLGNIYAVLSKAAEFVSQISMVVRAFEDVGETMDDDGLAAAVAFAKVVKPVSDAIEAGTQALITLAESAIIDAQTILFKALAFGEDIHTLVRVFADIGLTMEQDALDAAVAFAKAVKPISDAVLSGTKGIITLSDASYADMEVVLQKTTAFGDRISALIGKFVEIGARLDQDALDAAVALANAVKPIGDAILSGTKGLIELANASLGDMDVVLANVDAFGQQIVVLVGKFIEIGGTLSEDALSAAVAFANAVKPVGDAVKAGIEALDALMEASFASMDVVLAKIDLFGERIVALVGKFVEIGNTMETDALAAAVAFANAVKPVADATNGALGALEELAQAWYLSSTKVNTNMDALKTQIQALVAKYGEMSEAMGEGLVQTAITFAGNVNALVNATIDAIHALNELVTTDVEGGLGDMLDRMVEMMQGTVDPAIQAMQDIYDGWADILASLFELVTASSEDITTAIDEMLAYVNAAVAAQLSNLYQTMHDQFSTIASDVVSVLESMQAQIVSLLDDLEGAFYRAGIGMMYALANAIDAAADVPYEHLQDALAALAALLPHSDADEGPLSTLTASGQALATTFAKGIALGAEDVRREMEDLAAMAAPMPTYVAPRPYQTAPAQRVENKSQEIHIVINNPVGQPSEADILKQLRTLAALGVLDPIAA